MEAVEKVGRAMLRRGRDGLGIIHRAVLGCRGRGRFSEAGRLNPAVGQTGRLEKVDEIRLETVVPIGGAEAVIRRFGPIIHTRSRRLI